MGRFQIALNYLSPLLGKKYAQSGLEDMLIKSGVYAAGTTSITICLRVQVLQSKDPISAQAYHGSAFQAFVQVGLENSARIQS